MERRNNERKNKSGKYFCLKLQDTTYLNREILQGKSLQATTLYG